VLQLIRYLLDRPLCFRPERKLAGSGLHRRINCALQGTPNNEAERALRHWVIARRIMMGTRCDAGSRTFTLLASVIETCRQRGHVPWTYLAGVIADRRAGRSAAPLPVALPGL
jgi:hypothetical protein